MLKGTQAAEGFRDRGSGHARLQPHRIDYAGLGQRTTNVSSRGKTNPQLSAVYSVGSDDGIVIG